MSVNVGDNGAIPNMNPASLLEISPADDAPPAVLISPDGNSLSVNPSAILHHASQSHISAPRPYYGYLTAWIPLENVMYMDTNLFMFYSVWILAVFFLAVYIVSFNQHFMALICSFTRLFRTIRVPPPDINEWPSVSIVKPLLGVDKQLMDNLETFFSMDYKGKFELLFCVEDPQDSALGVVQTLISKYPKVDVRIFDKGAIGAASINGVSSGKPGDNPTIINPMVRNMVQGYEAARHDYIWISSSRCRGSGDMLRDMVARATDPTVGLVHQMPYIWVPPLEENYGQLSTCPSGSISFGSTMERLYFSTSLARPYLALSFMHITCFTGMSYVFRHSVMEQAGGLRSFGHYLAEDYQLSAAINRLGYRHVVAAIPAMQNNGPDLSLNTLKDRLVRWHRLRIHLMPFVSFCLEPFQECLIVGAAASWALHFIFSLDPIYFFPAHIFVWFCLDALLFCSGHRNLSTNRPCCCCCGPARMNPFLYVVAWMAMQLLPLYIIFESLCNPRHIRWGKHTYKLSLGAVAKIVQ